MRMIAKITNNILCLFNIELPTNHNTSFNLKQATLMPESRESIVNNKKSVITKCCQFLTKTEILDQLDSFDNDVDTSI